MFKPISGRLSQRLNALRRRQKKETLLQNVFRSFCRERYQEHVADQCFLAYDESERMVTIQTNNKTLANELLLHIGELNKALTSNAILVSRIVIR